MTRAYPAAFSTILAFACGPEAEPEDDRAREYGESLCAAIDDCGCEARLDARDECVEEFAARVQNELNNGAEINDDCFASVTEALGACTTPATVCVAVQGNRGEGESCTSTSELGPLQFSQCSPELICRAGACRSPSWIPPDLEIGDECVQGPDNICPLGSLCTYENVCEERAELGGACQDLGCRDVNEAYCAGAEGVGTGTCSAKIQIGGACNPLDWGACASAGDDEDSWCDPALGVCVAGAGRLCTALNVPYLWRDD